MVYNGYVDLVSKPGNQCLPCPDGYTCENNTITEKEDTPITPLECLTEESDYIGSMYYMLARYAADVCMRPSAGNNKYALSQPILQDISTVMTEIQSDMTTELAKECERLGGNWVNIPLQENTNTSVFDKFYDETASNKKWGYCAPK